MKKSKPEPVPVMDYRQYAERGGWYMSAATMTARLLSRWMMGRNVLRPVHFLLCCCAGGFGRRYCRRIEELETALFHRMMKKCAVCGALFTHNRADAAGMCRTHDAGKRREAQAKTTGEMSRFGAENPCKSKTFRGCQRQADRFILRPLENGLKMRTRIPRTPRRNPVLRSKILLSETQRKLF